MGVGDCHIAEFADEVFDALQLRIAHRRAAAEIAEQQLKIVEIDRCVAIEIPLIPKAGIAESSEEVLKIVKVDRSIHVGVAEQIWLDDNLAWPQVGV